jgi:multidrug resistance efflux pump
MRSLFSGTVPTVKKAKSRLWRNWAAEVSSSPIGLLVLVIICLSSVTLAWAILYRIKPTSNGIGITVKRGLVSRVYTPISGRVVSVKVKLGHEVRKGDVIATIDNTSELISASNRDELAEISEGLSRRQIEFEELSTLKQIEATKASMRTLQGQLADNRILFEKMKNLQKTNDVSYAELLAQQKTLDDIEIQILSLKGKVKSLESELLKITMDTKSQEINSRQYAELEDYNLELSKNIVAREDGIVTLIDVSQGDYVKEGDTVAQVSYKTGVMKGVFIMPANMAKRVKPGDQCLVSPAESPPERYGYVRAIAESVGILPTNPGEFQRRIGLDYTSEQLFGHLAEMNNGNPFNAFPYLVVVSIKTENDRPVWTTGKVPPWGFVSGTAADVQCIYDEWSPLQYIVPALRKEAGFTRPSS